MAKITKKQLETIVEFQTEINTILSNIGTLEAQKHSLLHKIAGVNEKIENNKIELEKQYGAVNINLETGEYTEIEKEDEPSNT
tara:strand:- start:439 stop:687 length:249 start_codon:yes stop_codon:yes gene_type:complete